MFSGIYLHASIECLFPSGSWIDEARQVQIGNGLLPVWSTLSEAAGLMNRLLYEMLNNSLCVIQFHFLCWGFLVVLLRSPGLRIRYLSRHISIFWPEILLLTMDSDSATGISGDLRGWCSTLHSKSSARRGDEEEMTGLRWERNCWQKKEKMIRS